MDLTVYGLNHIHYLTVLFVKYKFKQVLWVFLFLYKTHFLQEGTLNFGDADLF